MPGNSKEPSTNLQMWINLISMHLNDIKQDMNSFKQEIPTKKELEMKI